MAKVVIHRTRIGRDIVAEFAIPTSMVHQKKGRVAVLCAGAPSMPGKSSVIEFLARKGFFVVLPRYRGSWESSGKFLAQEPTLDIEEVIERLRDGVVSLYEGRKYNFPQNPSVYLFASSFGAPASMFLSHSQKVKAVVALSPVCDWSVRSDGEPLEKMDAQVREMYGAGYRTVSGGWLKLQKGNFYNPMTALERIDGSKILLFHARNDTAVPFRSVFDFAYATGAILKATETGGHLGLSELIQPDIWRLVSRFLAHRP